MSAADRPQVLYLWGDDEWAMDRTVASLAAEIASASGAPPERWRADGRSTSAAVIAEQVSIAPMFGGGTVAVVANPMPLVRSKALQEAFGPVIASVAPGNALVLLEFHAGASDRRPKSLQELEAQVVRAGGTARQCRAPGPGEMPSWITGRARDLGLSLEPDAARELARRIGSHVGESDVDRRGLSAMAVGELEKLSLYRGRDPVTADDVRALVAEQVPDSIWALTDAIALRRASTAAPALSRILESQPEQVVLVLLHRRLRELLIAADARARGAAPPEIVKLMGANPRTVPHRVEQAARWTVAELEAALDGLLELDRMGKRADAAVQTDEQRRMAWVAWVAERVAPAGAAGTAPSSGARTARAPR